MAKYNYNKEALKGLGVGAFLGEVKVRNAKIEAAPDTMPKSIFNSNILAQNLHPDVQYGKITKVVEHKDAKSFVIEADEAAGTTALAYFRAGQYLSVGLDIKGATVSKPYTIRSNPKDALGKEGTSYTLTIKHTKGGFASEYILSEWKEGTKVTLSGPQGDFCYSDLRDAKEVVAIAGGSGITPFYSMAAAIADGIEEFNLTILYGSRSHDQILLKEELDEVVERSKGKVKVVHILSDEEMEGYEHGFITAELIKKYANGSDYSVFVCGPKVMYSFMEQETAKLGLAKRRVRFEVPGEYGDPTKDAAYPNGKVAKSYQLTVIIRGEERKVTCESRQSLLQAIEAAGIHAPSRCRSGECGWCHSRLVSGEVYIPESCDGRREADKKFGWIHPCATYPLSDVCVEVFPVII